MMHYFITLLYNEPQKVPSLTAWTVSDYIFFTYITSYMYSDIRHNVNSHLCFNEILRLSFFSEGSWKLNFNTFIFASLDYMSLCRAGDQETTKIPSSVNWLSNSLIVLFLQTKRGIISSIYIYNILIKYSYKCV